MSTLMWRAIAPLTQAVTVQALVNQSALPCHPTVIQHISWLSLVVVQRLVRKAIENAKLGYVMVNMV